MGSPKAGCGQPVEQRAGEQRVERASCPATGCPGIPKAGSRIQRSRLRVRMPVHLRQAAVIQEHYQAGRQEGEVAQHFEEFIQGERCQGAAKQAPAGAWRSRCICRGSPPNCDPGGEVADRKSCQPVTCQGKVRQAMPLGAQDQPPAAAEQQSDQQVEREQEASSAMLRSFSVSQIWHQGALNTGAATSSASPPRTGVPPFNRRLTDVLPWLLGCRRLFARPVLDRYSSGDQSASAPLPRKMIPV